jgi:hypothetical protein
VNSLDTFTNGKAVRMQRFGDNLKHYNVIIIIIDSSEQSNNKYYICVVNIFIGLPTSYIFEL